MSTSKHIDKICIIVIAVALVLTLVFVNGKAFGIQASARTMGYESRLFDTASVHQIDIVMDDWDTFIENAESEEYSSCTAVIDGEKFANIGLRAKGNTSLSTVRSSGSQRYSFKIEFDQYVDGKTYYGLDKLCLNNLIQDNTMMKDYLVYQMMYEFGVEAPLCSFVYITVNGEDWGLYLAVEGVEDAFLERNYGSDPGELYKPDSQSFGGGRGNGKDFNMEDFDFEEINSEESAGNAPQMPTTENGEQATPPQMPNGDNSNAQQAAAPEMPSAENGEQPTPPDSANGEMPQMPDGENSQGGPGGMPGDMGGGPGGSGSDDVKLKYIDDDPDSYANIFDNAKTNVTKADKKRLINSLKNLSEYKDIENTVNVEEVIRYFVVHNFVCNGDSYTGTMIHNYYLHEKDGILSMIPWDYNLAFGTFQGNAASSTINKSIDNPVDNGDVDDRSMLGWIFSDETYTQQYHDTFAEFLQKYFANGELVEMIQKTADLIRPYVEKDPTKFCTTEEFETGVETITTFVELRAEAVSRQLSGDETPVDTGSLNLSDMGTMNQNQNMPGGPGGEAGGNMPGGMGQDMNGNSPQMPDGQVPGANTSGDNNSQQGGPPQMPGNENGQGGPGGNMPNGQTPNGNTNDMPGGPGGQPPNGNN